MARGPCTFRLRDLKLALKGAKAAGFEISRYEIDRQGTIVVFPSTRDLAAAVKPDLKGWEDVQ